MTQMNLSMKQSQIQRTDLQLPRGRREEEPGVWDKQMQTITHRMDKQRGPIVWYSELSSMSCGQP